MKTDYGYNELALEERYADNGEFSHYELIDLDTGAIVWPEPIEDTFLREYKSRIALRQIRHIINDTIEKEKNENDPDHRIGKAIKFLDKLPIKSGEEFFLIKFIKNQLNEQAGI